MFLKNTAWKGEERKLIQTLVGCRAEALFLLKAQTTFVESKENSNETKANPNKFPTDRNEVYS
jgi:hypothetical protein